MPEVKPLKTKDPNVKQPAYPLRSLPANTLHIGPSGSGKSVVEVTPEKKVVWEIKGKVPGTDINLHWMTCLQERENGNFIVGNCHAGPDNPQIFEITREKKVVWEYNEFELVGNGLACWQVLDGKAATRLRKQIAALK